MPDNYSKLLVEDARGGEAALPCLNSNISIEGSVKLSTQHRKSAFVLKESVAHLASRYGLMNLGFLTLTFADHVLCPKEAQRRLNSLISNVIKPRYAEYVGVMERQKSGRIHYHMLVVVGEDIRTGVDFEGFAKCDYKTANSKLRAEWAFWRKTAKKYRFGRTELLPVRSSLEAISKYVGKYIAKHIDSRSEADKGARLVRYSRGARAGTTRFMFQSEGSKAWRRKVATFAAMWQVRFPDRKVNTIDDLAEILGPHWAYNWRDFILSLP